MIVTNLSNPEAEQALLASVLREPGSFATLRERVSPDDFDAKEHVALWDLFGELHSAGIAPDPIAVRDQSTRNGHGVPPEALERIALAGAGGVPSHAEKIVLELSRRRKLAKVAFEIDHAARDMAEDPERSFSESIEYAREIIFPRPDAEMGTVAELIAADIPDPPWRIKGLLRVGKTALLFGPSHAGKSVLATQIALAAARGDQGVLGFDMPGVPARVGYFMGENDPHELREIAMRQLDGNSAPTSLFYADVFSTRASRPLAHPNGIAYYRSAIDKHKLDLAVIDNLMSLVGSDLKDSETAVHVMESFKRTSKETGVSWLVLAHPRKQGKEGDSADLADQLYGAHEWFSYADAAMHISTPPGKKDAPERHVHVPKVRGIKPRKPFITAFDDVTWTASYVADLGGEHRTSSALELLQALKAAKKPVSRKDLADSLNVTERTVQNLLNSNRTIRDLIDSGEIKVTKANRNGNPEELST